ncbi:MAG: hypothetical protein CL844_00825 [Crocinitomicaceae bacterium]|nr:hypothetical protein [Crocinitomicaceae bacterium]|tara:strand:- start:14446 stop:15414 length:969 start_codon:yes stop_codon:yes gene_type:complete
MGILILLFGLSVLVVGGELLVRGAVGFSKKMKISSLVIGMTVVAFGTSAPELLVSAQSAIGGNPGIAIGNVIGSNIANISLVLALTVIVFPIVMDRQTMRIDFPIMIFSMFLFSYFSFDGIITLIEGLILFSLVFIFTFFLFINSRSKENKSVVEIELSNKESFGKLILFFLLGFICLYFGAEWFIDGSVIIANYLFEGNPDKDLIIGVTVVAFGTSVPELATSLVAAYRKEPSLSIGNLIGSNIFNILLVLGFTSIIKPIKVSQDVLIFDSVYMIGVAFLLMILFLIGKKINRFKGIVLILSYIVYILIVLFRMKTGVLEF